MASDGEAVDAPDDQAKPVDNESLDEIIKS